MGRIKISMLAVICFLLFSLSTAHGQTDNETVYRKLLRAKQLVSEFLAKDYKHVEDMLDSLKIVTCHPELKKIYDRWNSDISNDIGRYRNKQKSEEATSTITAALDFERNPYQAKLKYFNKVLYYEGEVLLIKELKPDLYYLVLQPNIYIPLDTQKLNYLRNIRIGDIIKFKGEIVSYLPTTAFGPQILLGLHKILDNHDDIETLNKIGEKYDSMLIEIGAEVHSILKSLKSSIVREKISKGKKSLERGDYEKSIKYFDSANKYSPKESEIKEEIELAKKHIKYSTADSLLGMNKFEEAYPIFLDLAINENNFNNSREKFQTGFAKFINVQSVRFRQADNIRGYLSLLDSLRTYSDLDSLFIDSLYSDWRNKYIAFTRQYYAQKINKSNVIPGGYYYDRNRDRKFIETFLIPTIETDSTFILSYKIYSNKHIPDRKSISRDYYTFNPERHQNKIKEWLNIDLISRKEKEYIRIQGWRSLKECDLFDDKGIDIYQVNPEQPEFCVRLQDIDDGEFRIIVQKLAGEIKSEINRYTVLQREKAYYTGQVNEIKRYFFIPDIGWDFASNEWKQPEGENNLYIKRTDLVLGGFVGYNFQEINSRWRNILGIKINYRKSYGSDSGRLFTDSASIPLDINEYSLSGFEIELQYRPVSTKGYKYNFIAGIGYGYYQTSYKLTNTENKTILTDNENISTLKFNAGIGLNLKYFLLNLSLSTNYAISGKQFRSKSGLPNNISFSIGIALPFSFQRSEEGMY